MKKQSILILLIILGGSSASIIYASGTTITNTSVTTPTLNAVNVNISGTCTGCGGGEGSFTVYSLVLNKTVTGTSGNNGVFTQVSTNGSSISSDSSSITSIIKLDGTIVSTTTTPNTYQSATSPNIQDQSLNGKYMIITNNSGPSLDVYKNQALLQQITIDTTHSFFNTSISIGISQDGKYIVLYGDDKSNSIDHIQVWQGT